jgi:hypothetical protein
MTAEQIRAKLCRQHRQRLTVIPVPHPLPECGSVHLSATGILACAFNDAVDLG